MPEISVILPVYNVADYICDCIDSLIAQTLEQSVECLFVDDHGTDDSISRAYHYILNREGARPMEAAPADVLPPIAWRNFRFRFLQTSRNSGPGIAHNVGIEAASGDYISMIDSDDVIHPTMLARLLHKARAAQADFCYCQLVYRGGKRDGRVGGNPVIADGALSDAARRQFLVSMKTFCPTFLFRRSFLIGQGLRFPAFRSSEDSNFQAKVLLTARRAACVDEPLYVYCIHGSSLTQTCNVQRYKEKLQAFGALLHEARERGWYAPMAAEIDFLYIKKAFAVGALDYLGNAADVSADVMGEMRAALAAHVPAWRQNAWLRRRPALYLLVWSLMRAPLWSLRMTAKLLPQRFFM